MSNININWFYLVKKISMYTEARKHANAFGVFFRNISFIACKGISSISVCFFFIHFELYRLIISKQITISNNLVDTYSLSRCHYTCIRTSRSPRPIRPYNWCAGTDRRMYTAHWLPVLCMWKNCQCDIRYWHTLPNEQRDKGRDIYQPYGKNLFVVTLHYVVITTIRTLY